MCTRNDRDARLAERCLLLGEMEYIVPSYSFFSTSTLVILPRENSVSNKWGQVIRPQLEKTSVELSCENKALVPILHTYLN